MRTGQSLKTLRKVRPTMEALLFLLFFVFLAAATALGLTADSRVPGRWYPALPDDEA